MKTLRITVLLSLATFFGLCLFVQESFARQVRTAPQQQGQTFSRSIDIPKSVSDYNTGNNTDYAPLSNDRRSMKRKSTQRNRDRRKESSYQTEDDRTASQDKFSGEEKKSGRRRQNESRPSKTPVRQPSLNDNSGMND